MKGPYLRVSQVAEVPQHCMVLMGPSLGSAVCWALGRSKLGSKRLGATSPHYIFLMVLAFYNTLERTPPFPPLCPKPGHLRFRG